MADPVIHGLGLTLEELEAYLYLVALAAGAAATGLMLAMAVDLARMGRRRAAVQEREAQRGHAGGPQPAARRPPEPRGAGRPHEAPGVDVALARHAMMSLLEKLRSGEVRVELRSPDCPGEVVLDLSEMELKCLEVDGTLRRLGEKPARDRVEELDLGEEEPEQLGEEGEPRGRG